MEGKVKEWKIDSGKGENEFADPGERERERLQCGGTAAGSNNKRKSKVDKSKSSPSVRIQG